MDELLSCHQDFSNNELLHSSIGLLQMLSGLHYQSIFYSDRLLSESLSDFLLSRSTSLRASFELHQCPSFSSSRTSTVTRLHPSFYDGRSPFGFHPSSYKSQTLSELLQWMGSKQTSTTDGLQQPDFYNDQPSTFKQCQPDSNNANQTSTGSSRGQTSTTPF